MVFKLDCLHPFFREQGLTNEKDRVLELVVRSDQTTNKERNDFIMQPQFTSSLHRSHGRYPMTQTGSHLGETWNKAYKKLLDFAKKEGHLRVPPTLLVDSVPLSKWKSNIISRYHHRMLSHEKIRLLERIPGWSWNDKEEQKDRLDTSPAGQGTNPDPPEEPQEEDQEHGDHKPSASAPTGVPLPRHPAIENISQLRPLRPRRQPRMDPRPNTFPQDWKIAHATLENFVRREGHTAVPTDHLEGDFPLGQWVMEQRSAHSKGELPKKLAALLRGIPGWSFGLKKKANEGQADKKEKNKRIKPPSAAASCPNQELEGEDWDLNALTWDEVCNRLETFVEAHGKLRASIWRFSGVCASLNTWLLQQKKAYYKAELPLDQRRRLESLPGFFSDREIDKIWHDTFEHLWFFIRKEKHAQVPMDHEVEGVSLGKWVAEQRRLYHHGELAELRLRKLEALPLWTWTPEPIPDSR
jgi:hypothetical protein